MKKAIFSAGLFWFLLASVNIFASVRPVKHNSKHTPVYKADKPSVTKTPYGEIDGQKIDQYTLTNSKGMQVKIIGYGATITDVITPDKNQQMGHVVLGFDSLKNGYLGRSNALLGAVVGRVANRISNKKFTIDGQEYVLTSNIHGGIRGFNRKIWAIEEMPGNNKEVSVKLTYLSKDGEEGYPGNLNVTIVYTLTNNNEFKLTYSATTDKATPVVLTNHTYFNLTGTTAKVLNTELTVLADKYLEADKETMPTGKLLDVKNTPYDFTKPKPIGKDIDTKEDQLIWGGGYDLTFALRNQTGKLALAATAYDPGSGRVMQVYTTEPGLVFYTGNHLSERSTGRGGEKFTSHGALCMETQHYPDSPNKPNFPNVILRPGETFSSQTVYKFSVRN